MDSDLHVNQVIKDAIANDGLKLSVISPVSPYEFYKNVLAADTIFSEKQVIWEGLHRYYCGTRSDLTAERDTSFLTPDGQGFFSDWLV
jgi:hypothetical protein